MAILDIKTFGEPVLRENARPVDNVDDRIRRLIEDMFHTMYQAPGVGLAAPQIGESLRIIVADHAYSGSQPGEPIALINPVILSRSDETDQMEEGCLSIPDVAETVERSLVIDLSGITPDGKEIKLTVEGFQARVLQHEIDHLDGVLFVDKIVSSLKRSMVKKRLIKKIKRK
jgi:peptide deformylase